MHARLLAILIAVCAVSSSTAFLFAEDPPPPAPVALTPATVFRLDNDDDQQPTGRYFFGLLDGRSSYGKDFFPDPFLGPEFDAEQQAEVDYLHAQGHGRTDDEVDGEVQWNLVGKLTICAEFGWDSQRQAVNLHGGATGDDDDTGSSSGLENLDLAVYHPLFQSVSDNGVFDYTAAARLDIGIPTRTPASGTDLQLTPFLGQLLRLGRRTSIETWTGAQFTIGPAQNTQFIYGALLGYEIPRQQLPLPLIDTLTPIIELDGQSPFSGPGQDSLFAVAGASFTFRSLGLAQPQLQVGYQFPIDQGARDQLQWGIVAEFFVGF